MEPIVVGTLNTIARTVAPLVFSYQSKRIQKLSNKRCCGLAWSGVACGVARIFAMARPTIVEWLKAHVQNLPDVKETLLPATPDDVLELDEIWSFVRKKDQTRWVWMAMCRRTRHIVAFAIGDRSKATCLRFWQAIPYEYKHCHTFSDFWPAYHYVFPAETHHCVEKETGETAHMERWNNTLRQRVDRYVRQTLSFSKSDESHDMVTKGFIVQYNLGLSLTI
ncbi:MAG TPA: IS1 family transposase [Ktedonobacteraceae bacterium]|jgi:IS1 family transposase